VRKSHEEIPHRLVFLSLTAGISAQSKPTLDDIIAGYPDNRRSRSHPGHQAPVPQPPDDVTVVQAENDHCEPPAHRLV
jgi:hypothetical protein